MPETNIKQIVIKGLFGEKGHIELPLSNNRLILIGENGSGKTTLINMIYYFVSSQWEKLARYNFEEITIEIGKKSVRLSKKELEPFFLPIEVIHDLGKFSNGFQQRLQLPGSTHREAPPKRYERLQNIARELSSVLGLKPLYLPTYRRIEADISSFIPWQEGESFFEYAEKVQTTEEKSRAEVIKFGMKDVKQNIDSKLSEIKDFIRNELRELTGSYLTNILNRDYRTVTEQDIATLSQGNVDQLLKRIDDKSLPATQKTMLMEAVQRITGDSTHLQDEDKILLHVLLQLSRIQENIAKREKDVIDFVGMCNKYLVAKRVVYDRDSIEVYIEDTRHDRIKKVATSKAARQTIAMETLSSGEKQIVALFNVLFLSNTEKFLILIDEPELSLSVPWQTSFLEDVSSIEYCGGIIAATHSPFIYDNSLDYCTKAIEECWRRNDL